MKIREIKILENDLVQIVFEGTFKEFENVAAIELDNLIRSLKWRMNDAPRLLHEALLREEELRKKLREEEV